MVDVVDIPRPVPTPEITPPPMAPEGPPAPERIPDEPGATVVDTARENHQGDAPFTGVGEVAKTKVPEGENKTTATSPEKTSPATSAGDEKTEPAADNSDAPKKDEDSKDKGGKKEEPTEEEKTMEDLKKKEAEYKKLLKELADLKTLRTLATDEKSQKIVDTQIDAKQAEIAALLGTVAEEAPKGMSKAKLGLLILMGITGILASAAVKGAQEANK